MYSFLHPYRRTTSIYRWRIGLPSVPTRTDGQGFWGLPYGPCNNAKYLIHERILYIYRSCIHFYMRTDRQLRFTDEELVSIGTDRTDGQGFWGLPYALAIMLTTSFTKGFCNLPIVYSFLHPYRRTTSIYRWRIGLPSVPTVPMDKVFGGYFMPLQ